MTPAEAAEQYADLAEMTGGFVHDLRNQLGTVMLNLQLLGEDFEEPKTHAERRAKDRVARMTTECQRLVTVAQEFLRFARIDDLQREPQSLDVVVSRVIDFLSPTARQQGVEVHWFPEADLPNVSLDAEHFERVLLNLMLNAEDAMPNGGTLTLQARAEGGFVVLEVIDTRCGIAADVLPKLFQPFRTTKPDGTGLGLTTARKIVRAHGGSLGVQSDLGRGTKFSIRLPVDRETEADA